MSVMGPKWGANTTDSRAYQDAGRVSAACERDHPE